MRDWLIDGAKKDSQSITTGWDYSKQRLIDGAAVREIKNVVHGKGLLTEVFRRDWDLDGGQIDQVFQVILWPQAVSAWHLHESTTDRLLVNHGTLKIVLYDSRENSPTKGLVNEFRVGIYRPYLVVVPPKVWHGVQNISGESGSILNLVDEAYKYEEPDHWRLPPDSPEIPYSFTDSKPTPGEL